LQRKRTRVKSLNQEDSDRTLRPGSPYVERNPDRPEIGAGSPRGTVPNAARASPDYARLTLSLARRNSIPRNPEAEPASSPGPETMSCVPARRRKLRSGIGGPETILSSDVRRAPATWTSAKMALTRKTSRGCPAGVHRDRNLRRILMRFHCSFSRRALSRLCNDTGLPSKFPTGGHFAKQRDATMLRRLHQLVEQAERLLRLGKNLRVDRCAVKAISLQPLSLPE